MQRGQLRSRPVRALFNGRLWGPRRKRIYQRYGLPLEQLFKRSAERKLSEQLNRTFSTFSDYLPNNTARILDIGSGMGGINILTYRAAGTDPEVWLLDRDGVSVDWNAGYHSDPATFSYYNSFAQAKTFLSSNGVPVERIHCVDISSLSFPQENFQVVYSFLSWGFHYPVSLYIDDVYDSLSDKGLLVIDVRNDTDGAAVLRKKFAKEPISVLQGEKFERMCILK